MCMTYKIVQFELYRLYRIVQIVKLKSNRLVSHARVRSATHDPPFCAEKAFHHNSGPINALDPSALIDQQLLIRGQFSDQPGFV